MSSRTVALIPLRGGSQSIPDKNIRVIAGKPLCCWALEAACKCDSIDDVYVSTDSERIRRTVESFGFDVKVLDRPAELATSKASTESVMLNFANRVDFSTLVTIQATSPLTTSLDLTTAIELFRANDLDSLLTGVIEKRFVWELDGTPLNYQPSSRPLRQEWKGSLVENGAFYLTKASTLLEKKCRLGGKIGTYAMPAETAWEIDEVEDWARCESLLCYREAVFGGVSLESIRCVLCDVDGTLTDGGMYYSPNGEELKKFHTRDAHGLSMLVQDGIEVAIVTAENSGVSKARAEKLGLPIFLGVRNKADWLTQFCQDRGYTPSELAMIGDDVNDVEVMQRVAFAACPADAVPDVKRVADFVATRDGGEGAVREACDLLLRNRP